MHRPTANQMGPSLSLFLSFFASFLALQCHTGDYLEHRGGKGTCRIVQAIVQIEQAKPQINQGN